MELSGLDIVFLVVLVFAALRSGIRGFVREFMSVAALVAGIGIAVVFSGLAAVYLEPWTGDGAWSQVIAFLGLFLIVYVVVKLFESALNRLVEKINLESLDRALGFFLGLIEGVLLIFFLIIIMQVQPVFDATPVLAESIIAQFLLPLLPYAERLISQAA